jgi:hypothetical protein
MASDPFCGVASGSVDVHLNVEGSAPFCAKQTGDEHQIAKSNRSEATVKTPFSHVFANEQRNVNEVNLIGFIVSIRFTHVVKPVGINLHIVRGARRQQYAQSGRDGNFISIKLLQTRMKGLPRVFAMTVITGMS